jgi:hypothetical protein
MAITKKEMTEENPLIRLAVLLFFVSLMINLLNSELVYDRQRYVKGLFNANKLILIFFTPKKQPFGF